MTEESKRIVAMLRAVPRSRVASYGQIARAAGCPGAARTVVRLLHALAEKEQLPWHRIVRADGSLALPRGSGYEEQAALLASEGVILDDRGRVPPEAFAVL